ncbi:MAG TPA: hypothetical protein VM490_05590, partial [Armatimonadaceae bacterium]|nr:hypothetical protein [Armatimonadaceae bacterium]
GAVTVLAPEQMMVIADDPGRANPFAAMSDLEALDVFLASLTPGQWQTAGSRRGIGMADLAPDQQAIYDRVLPPAVRVLTQRVEATPDAPDGRTRGVVMVGEGARHERARVRLRLKRETEYRFYFPDGRLSPYGSNQFNRPRVGDSWQSLVGEEYDRNPAAGEGRRSYLRATAYGVALRTMVRSRPKPGHLDFTAPALNGTVPLTADLKTVRDVLDAVGRAAGFELHADRRAAVLPVFLRTAAPGQRARGGDLLIAVARAVTGAYRRMDDSVYLLTDDVEGIATRYARLGFWAAEAEERKRQFLETVRAAGRPNPLAYAQYDADARDALPDDLSKRVEANWPDRDSRGVLSFRVADLPDSVRRDVEYYAREIAGSGGTVALDTARVGISLSIDVRFVLPDGTEARDPRLSVAPLSSRILAAGRGGSVAAAVAAPPATHTPRTVARRVILTPAPSAEEARALVAAAKRRGLSEVWIDVPLAGAAEPDTAALRAAVAAGYQAGVAVCAAVSVLKGRGVGTPERNVLGQDGDALFAESMAFYGRLYEGEALAAAERRMARYRDWLAPDADLGAIRVRQIGAVAATPGLAGLTLRHTAGPGYTLEIGGATNGQMGYTPALRLAFLREAGQDPVDVVRGPYFLGGQFSSDLPFFAAGSLESGYRLVDGRATMESSAWLRFREARNRELLAALFASLKRARPALPLFIDDRLGSHETVPTSWYASWDAADRAPAPYTLLVPDDRLAAARAASKTLLLLQAAPPSAGPIAETADPGAWDGSVLDLSEMPPADALRLLGSAAAARP